MLLLNANSAMARSLELHGIADLCVSLQEHQVERKLSINLEMGIVQRLAARATRALDLAPDAPEAARAAIWTRAQRIVRRGLTGGAQAPEDAELGELLAPQLTMARAALAPVAAFRAAVEAAMCEKARLLPGFALTERVAGFKALGLAVIVGEAGDLSNYASERKLWRRLGLGVAPGHEAHAYSTWRWLGLPAGEWNAPDFLGQPRRAGYSPKRLGQIYGVVTVPLAMHKAKSRYGEVYAARRARTAETHPAGTPAECKLDPNRWTPAHAHMDALRVMTKALISDLWSEWRGSSPDMDSEPNMAPAEFCAVRDQELASAPGGLP